MDDLRVAHVVAELGGGIGQLLEWLLPEMVQSGTDTTLFASRIHDEQRAAFERGGVAVRGVDADLRRELGRCDVAHFYTLNLDLLHAGARSRARVVYSMLGLRATSPRVSGRGRLRLPKPSGFVRRARRRAFERFLRRDCDLVTAPSRYLAGELAHAYGVAETKTVVIPNGIPVARFAARVAEAPAHSGFVVGCVGRLAAVKRLDLLLEAVAAATAGGLACRLVIVGEGPLRADLERRAAALGIAETTTFTGRVDDPARYLREFDVFAFPSHNEGSPLAIMEAMATGLPCIAMTDGGGAAELVGDSGGGIVADGVGGLASALDRLSADPALRSSLGGTGRSYAARELDVSRCAARFIEAYGRVLRDADGSIESR